MEKDTSRKREALLKLANARQTTSLEGYDCVGQFHDGIFECDYVSPWSKSGHNVNAAIMIVGQDWASSDFLAAAPPNLRLAELGFEPSFPTNQNLDDLIKRHFNRARSDCYLTNLFPYVKRGGVSAAIPIGDLTTCARNFTLSEIRIVAPRVVIALGQRTFLALMRAAGIGGTPRMDEAVNSPFEIGASMVHCVAHTGALGMNNRGREQVERDWQRLQKYIR